MLGICDRLYSISERMMQEIVRPMRECNRRELYSEELYDLFSSLILRWESDW